MIVSLGPAMHPFGHALWADVLVILVIATLATGANLFLTDPSPTRNQGLMVIALVTIIALMVAIGTDA